MEDKEKLWTKDFVLVIIINFLVFLNHLMILSTFPFFIERLGYSDTVSGACATAFSLVAVLARPFVGWLLLALVPGNVTFLIAAALSGYAFGGIEPALQSMAVHTALPQRRGAANSTFLCAYDIGIGLGGGLAGLLIDRVGYGSMFGVIAVANVLSVAVYVLWGRRHASSMTRAICAGEKK